MSLETSEAVVLRTIEYGETSLIASFLTPNHGRISAIAKGLKRPGNTIGDVIEPITHLELVYYYKPGRNVQTIKEAEIINRFDDIKSDFARYSYASYCVELVGKVAAEGDSSEDLFRELVEGLRFIGSCNGKMQQFCIAFCLRVLKTAGVAPVLDCCVVCRAHPDGKRVFLSLPAGGLACDECTKEPAITLTAAELKLLGKLGCMEDDLLGRTRVPSEICAKLFEAINRFACYHIESDLKSLGFLKSASAAL
jgi:DNA repair protein RecO (recombination protein O)